MNENEKMFLIEINNEKETKNISVSIETFSFILQLNETIKKKNEYIKLLEQRLEQQAKQKKYSKFEIRQLLKGK